MPGMTLRFQRALTLAAPLLSILSNVVIQIISAKDKLPNLAGGCLHSAKGATVLWSAYVYHVGSQGGGVIMLTETKNRFILHSTKRFTAKSHFGQMFLFHSIC